MSRPRNDNFLRALLKEPTDFTPVWLMRQAGRYLPEYCETRKRAGNFLNLCKSPALACEVTLQPLSRYALDAAILFSDILTIPDAMGLGLYFCEGEGPKFERPLREEWMIRDLTAPDPFDKLRYVMDGVAEIRRALGNSVPLIGFSGSPYTLACYMVEGGASTDHRRIKSMLYDRPDLLHRILAVTSEAVTAYLNAQIDSGAQAVMIFDTWGGSLSAAAYREFSLHYMQRIIGGLKREKDGERVPVIVFTKGGGLWLEAIAEIGCDGIGRSPWATRGAASATKSLCRATSIPASFSRRLKRSPPRRRKYSKVTAPARPATSSIWDTEFRNSRRRQASSRSSKPCIGTDSLRRKRNE